MAELMACVDLISKGFQVFRAVSPSSDADLIGEKDGKLYRFEVRSAKYSLAGNLAYASNGTFGKSVLIVTLSDRKVHYMSNPEIEKMKSTYSGALRSKGIEPLSSLSGK